MSGWVEYVAAWAAFLGAHVIPALPQIRGRLVAWLGRGVYLALFSLVSLGLLYWLILAAGRAPYIGIWDFGGASRWLVNLAMPLAILAVCLSRGLSGLMLGFAIWAAAHLVANGDLAHILFFGGMLVFALLGLARLGLPKRFQTAWWRWLLAALVWAGLLHMHLPVIGVSPLPL